MRYHKLVMGLREARRSVGWSQRTLAVRVGLTPQTIKRLEQGIGSADTLRTVMEALAFRLSGVGPGANLAAQLRACRLRRSLTVADVARRAGLSRTTVNVLERGGGSVASLLSMLDTLAPRAHRRAAERSYWGQGDKEDRDSRFTPPEFLEGVDAAFGEIHLDPCGHPFSPVVARRRILLSEGGDGLVDDWSGTLAFVNPPFSQLLVWLRRAHDEWRAGRVETVVCLVPVRTDSRLFHETLSTAAHIFLLQGRVRFLDIRGRGQPTPFSLMLVALGSTAEQRRRYAEIVPGFWLSPTATDEPNAT